MIRHTIASVLGSEEGDGSMRVVEVVVAIVALVVAGVLAFAH